MKFKVGDRVYTEAGSLTGAGTVTSADEDGFDVMYDGQPFEHYPYAWDLAEVFRLLPKPPGSLDADTVSAWLLNRATD